jgi:hypothetical protein
LAFKDLAFHWSLFGSCPNSGANCRDRRNNRRNFQNGNEPFCFVVRAIWMRPAVSTFGLWMAIQIENLDFAFPDCFAAKYFMDWRGLAPSRAAIVQLHYRHLHAGNVFRFIRHNVQRVRQPSNGSFQFQPPLPVSFSKPREFSRNCNKRNSMQPQLQSFQAFC